MRCNTLNVNRNYTGRPTIDHHKIDYGPCAPCLTTSYSTVPFSHWFSEPSARLHVLFCPPFWHFIGIFTFGRRRSSLSPSSVAHSIIIRYDIGQHHSVVTSNAHPVSRSPLRGTGRLLALYDRLIHRPKRIGQFVFWQSCVGICSMANRYVATRIYIATNCWRIAQATR